MSITMNFSVPICGFSMIIVFIVAIMFISCFPKQERRYTNPQKTLERVSNHTKSHPRYSMGLDFITFIMSHDTFI